MLMYRVLAAVTLGILSVSALPRRNGDVAPDDVRPSPLGQEPLRGGEHFWPDIFDMGRSFFQHEDQDSFEPPHGSPPGWNPDANQQTIYQFLKEDEHFTRLFKLVNFTNEIINTLNDSSASLTIFAPPDDALRPPKRHASVCSDGVILAQDFEACFVKEQKDSGPLETLLALESLVSEYDAHDDHRKEILKRIVGAILSYHILPHSLSAADLAKNTTFGTSYAPNDGAFDGKPLRLHVEKRFRLLHPTLVVNFYARVLKPDIKASNGVVHVVNHPVLPPPAAFQELFLFSDHFSVFTSALQRVGLTEQVDWRYVPGEGKEKGTIEGSPTITIFAPTNGAFKKLPWKLQLFLFSPFGERILAKLLQFHIVPDLIVHSDYFHNATDSLVPCNADPECCMDADLNALELFSAYEPSFLDLSQHLATQTCSSGYPLNRISQGRGVITNRLGVSKDARTNEIIAVQPDFDPHRCTPMENSQPPHGFDDSVGSPVYAHRGHLPTLLTNHTLEIEVAQYEYKSPIPPHSLSYYKKVIVGGVPVKVADVPARNGAVHVIESILDPRGGGRHHHHHHGGPAVGCHGVKDEEQWAEWEEWLVKWADEN